MLPIPHGVSISDLILGAAAVLIVSFGAGIVTARSFGAKNKYPVDANRELSGFRSGEPRLRTVRRFRGDRFGFPHRDQ